MKCWKGVWRPRLKWKQGGDQGACKLLGYFLSDVIEVLGCLLEGLMDMKAEGVKRKQQWQQNMEFQESTSDHYIEPTELKIQEMVNIWVSGKAY
ncbi:hypothetical protein Tco_1375757 [Tanacetum coccineum]